MRTENQLYRPGQRFGVKLDGPLMSFNASGSIGGLVTFGRNKGRNFARQLVIPANPRTPAQTGVRSMMRFIGQEWAQMSPANQATWETRASQTTISPFAAFSSLGMLNWSAEMAAQREDPAETVATPAGPPTAIVPTVIQRRVTITWVDAIVGSDNFGVIVYTSNQTGFSPGRDNSVGVIDLGILSFTSATLEPGTYFFRLATFDVAGEIGTTSAQGTFTIV